MISHLYFHRNNLLISSKTITLQTIKHEAISEDVYELKYNFCNSITESGVDQNDFCADGTWACRLIKNNKNTDVRITSAKPIGSSEPVVTTNGDILGLRLMAENGSVTLNIKCKATVTVLSI